MVEPSVQELAVAIAGWGLPGQPSPWPLRPLSGRQWGELSTMSLTHRLVGLLDAVVDAGALLVTADQRAELGDLSAMVAATSVRIDAVALEVCAWLGSAAVDHRLLKGPVLAHTVYANAHHRCYGDVDVLVAPGRFQAAVSAIIAAGCRRAAPERRRGFDERFNKSITLLHPSGVEIDLHRTLAPVPFGPLIHVDDLFMRSAPTVIGGQELAALESSAGLIHVALHAVLSGSVRLTTLRDVAQLLPNADADEVQRLANRWTVAGPTASAIALARATFGLAPSPLSDWADTYVRTPRDARLLRPFEARGRAVLPIVVTTVRELPGARDKLAYAAAIVMPGRAYLRHRASGRLAFLWRGLAGARRRKGTTVPSS